MADLQPGGNIPPLELNCRLLAGPAAALAQVSLGVLALSVLVLQRHKERPQRPFKIWGMDVSKQVTSSVAAHFCGIFIAIFVSAAETKVKVSECAWYFVAYVFDTTLGVGLSIALHASAVRLARHRAASVGSGAWLGSIAECGSYGQPSQWARFWPQLLEWTLAVIFARFVCGCLVYVLRDHLIRVGRALDVLSQGHNTTELFLVMLTGPLLMNILQALVQDAVLKMRRPSGNSGALGKGAEADDAAMLPADAIRSA